MKVKITPFSSSFWRVSKKSQNGFEVFGSFRMISEKQTLLTANSSKLSLQTKKVSKLIRTIIIDEQLILESSLWESPAKQLTYRLRGESVKPLIIQCRKKGAIVSFYIQKRKIASLSQLDQSFILEFTTPPPLSDTHIIAAVFPFLF
ncbi:MAG: hypothetical protein DRP02_03830 [Candidatus Gerdarchaeota archaeon]|nr:MAG: hypothetical protein DRO63_00790 [Candidatus Gerdarchaeota archaeon]RLI71760.1 MAG: hypothetical protein DRP02_03830 [Candidatus Gerdarchaeota archaeon]